MVWAGVCLRGSRARPVRLRWGVSRAWCVVCGVWCTVLRQEGGDRTTTVAHRSVLSVRNGRRGLARRAPELGKVRQAEGGVAPALRSNALVPTPPGPGRGSGRTSRRKGRAGPYSLLLPRGRRAGFPASGSRPPFPARVGAMSPLGRREETASSWSLEDATALAGAGLAAVEMPVIGPLLRPCLYVSPWSGWTPVCLAAKESRDVEKADVRHNKNHRRPLRALENGKASNLDDELIRNRQLTPSRLESPVLTSKHGTYNKSNSR